MMFDSQYMTRITKEIMPIIAAGQARLIAKVIFAICSGGPLLTTNAIKGIANTLERRPSQESNQ